MDPIITIGREYGSGGREIGKLVADKLGVPFYDKEILTRAAEESGLCHELLERHDEKNTVSNSDGNPRAGIPYTLNLINEPGQLAVWGGKAHIPHHILCAIARTDML